jgi:hypothetical protein
MRPTNLLSRLFCARRLSDERSPGPKLSENWSQLENRVRYLIRDEKDFIVYIDHDLDIEWETAENLDRLLEAKGNDIKAKHYSVLAQAAVVETMPTEGLDAQRILRFKRLVGEAIVCCLECQYDAALSALDFARDYLRERTQEVSRFWYLSFSMFFAVLFILIACFFWFWRASLILIIGGGAFWLVIAGCSGALGALLSVMSRTGNLAFNSSSGRRLHRLEALSRISVGVLSGGLIGLAIQSKLFLWPLVSGSEPHLVIMIAAFAAGAGERLAPSIIAGFDKKVAAQDSRDDRTAAAYIEGTRNHAKPPRGARAQGSGAAGVAQDGSNISVPTEKK